MRRVGEGEPEQLIKLCSRGFYLERECMESTFPSNVNELVMPRIDHESFQIEESKARFSLPNAFIRNRFTYPIGSENIFCAGDR